MTETTELNPCPFCGSADIQSDGKTKSTSYIYCQNCGCEMHGCGPTKSKALSFATSRWNTRPAPAVEVKPLEWEKLADNMFRAELPVIGNIRAESYNGRDYICVWSVPGYCDTFAEGKFATADEAMAAAQAEYERRLAPTIQTRPAPDTAALVEALRYIIAEVEDHTKEDWHAGKQYVTFEVAKFDKARAALAAWELKQ